MDGTRRSSSSLTGRPLRGRTREQTHRLAEASDAPHGLDGQDLDSQDLDSRDLDSDVAASIETINKVTETYGVLLDKLSAYELKVRDLTQKLSDESRATGDALRAAARAEQTAREAQAKTARAEAEATRSAETVRELERQLGALRAQTSKLMDAVDQLFPDFDDAAVAPPRGLRVVR